MPIARQSKPGLQVRPVTFLHRLDRPQQDGGRMAFAFRYDVHAVVHP